MLNEAEQLIAQGFHNDAFNVVLQEMHFKRCMDLWSRVVHDVHQMVISNIYIYRGDGYAPFVNFLEKIELEGDLKLFASLWKADDGGKMVITRDGKIVISKEPLLTLMRLLGNQLDRAVYLALLRGICLAYAEKCVH